MDYGSILKELDKALEKAETTEKEFDTCKKSMSRFNKLSEQSKDNGLLFTEDIYNKAMEKYEAGSYSEANDILQEAQSVGDNSDCFELLEITLEESDGFKIKKEIDLKKIRKDMNKFMLNGDFSSAQDLCNNYISITKDNISDYNEAKNQVSIFNNLIEDSKKHILIEQFVPEQEAAEQNFEERDLKPTIDIAKKGIEKVEKALANWIPKIKLTLPEDLVATESNRASILVENIGKTKILSVNLTMEGLDAAGKLSTKEILPGKSAEIIVGLIPSTPGNIPVTINSTIVRSFDSTETSVDEEVWVQILRPGGGAPGGRASGNAKSPKKEEKAIETEIKPEWLIPEELSEDEAIIGDFFSKRWESYLAYPDNEAILDHLHNNREKYAISSYFEIPTEPEKVMEDWALPQNIRGNIHLDSKRVEIVRDIFEAPYEKNYVIIGEPGVGKTVLLFEVFDQLMKREPVGVLTNENIGNAHEKFKIKLFYDDISEKPDLYKAIASKDSIGGLILSSREAEWSELPVDFRKKFTRLTVPRFSDEEMETLILKTLEINAILQDAKALKLLVSYAQGSPIYVGSLIKEMIYSGIRRLSETYLKENAQKGMEGYVIMILQRLLKSGNDYRNGGLHTLSCLMFLANHVEERKCHEQLLRAFANEIDMHMEEKFNDVYDRRTFNRSIDYLSGQGSLVRFPHDTWVDILQGQGASNPFRPDIQEIRNEFEDTGMFEQLKKDSIDDAWEAIQKRYLRNNVREKDSFLELCDTLTSNFRLSDLKEMGVDVDMVREVASKHRDEPIAASILSRLEGAEPSHNVINIQDSVISRSDIGSTK